MLKKISKYAIAGTLIESISIPCSVKEIGCKEFANCKKLRLVKFHEIS